MRRHSIQRTSAAFLLAVFIAGGLLAPAVHRLHHGLAWAEVRGPSQACDHSQHGDRFEAALHTFEAHPCPLCLRHVAQFEDGPVRITALLDVEGVVAPIQVRPTSTFSLSLSIRGPPLSA